ncbi:MAG: S41 family peptidase [Bacteroidetes bacterium]|nr:S41 family peptidase [Bacteroidota bacterium]
MNKKSSYLLPLLFSVVLAVGMLLGHRYGNGQWGNKEKNAADQKLWQVLGVIDKVYVDTPNRERLVSDAIKGLLKGLDPYSSYIPAAELAHANEQLEGNFDGIGIELNIIRDTVTVLHVIRSGPSDRVGILPGDKFVAVNGENIAGMGYDNAEVVRRLKGPKSTEVAIRLVRGKPKRELELTLTREAIKIESVVATYMATPTTGYVKVTRFAGNTYGDFALALAVLRERGATNLIVDLRGNPGGYLEAATKMVDEFLEKGETITYTLGRARKKDVHLATGRGTFKEGKVCVLIDKGSASASEIFSGAIQDLDRGLVIGNPSHGKGLVQEPIDLSDGSQLRITVARYYTPSGRCIQKPYGAASAQHSATFSTKGGRQVFDAGGIVPDIAVEQDTLSQNLFINTLQGKGLMYDRVMTYLQGKSTDLLEQYPGYLEFIDHYTIDAPTLTWLNQYFVHDTTGAAGTKAQAENAQLAALQFKALVAYYVYDESVFHQILNQADPVFLKALEAIHSDMFAEYGIK